VLDEPTNGLDPEGIRWMRGFLRDYASRGRTVLVSSHLLAEVQQTVDQVVIIAHGRLVHEGDLATLERAASILVDGPDRAGIARALAPAAVEIREDGLRVTGLTTGEAGARVHAAGLELSLLAPERDGLESVFLELVG
jgi:ABC-2 type transport system ATP-binding protein